MNLALFSGYVLVYVCRAGVQEVVVIRDQMVLKSFVMMKMFLAAVATSMVSFYFMSQRENTRHKVTESSNRFVGAKPDRGLTAMCAGAFILGIGMTVSGSCPGTVYAQIGSGSYMSYVVFAGATVGATVFGLFDMQWLYDHSPVSHESKRLHRVMGLTEKEAVMRLSIFLGLFVVLLELLFPWQQELAKVRPQANWSNSLPASVAGVMLGLLQIPITMLRAKNLGASSSFCVAPAYTLFGGNASWEGSRKAWWQLCMMLGVVIGARLSSKFGGSTYTTDMLGPVPRAELSYVEAFFGGFLILFGARMAGGYVFVVQLFVFPFLPFFDVVVLPTPSYAHLLLMSYRNNLLISHILLIYRCTSGLGLSSTGHLSSAGFAGTACIFGGAMLTGALFYNQ